MGAVISRAMSRHLAAGTHIPTTTFRWWINCDGERILMQRCTTPGGVEFWKEIEVVGYDDY